MKIFLDTADLAHIKKWAYLLDGVTTNPTHLYKAGGDPKKVVLEICKVLGGKDVSVEITEQEPQAVYKQAQEIAALAPNVVVKIPCYYPYYAIIQQLAQEGIRLNITLVFSVLQGLYMSKLQAAYISPFVGRLDDIDTPGILLLEDLRTMIDQYGYSTEIIAASLRSVKHVHEAMMAGADVATMPVEVFEKTVEHPLTDSGMKKFNEDWKKLGITKFP